MAEKIEMNYFRGENVPMTQFYRTPKALYTAEYFKHVSFEAKAIYGMMIDRVGLSIKNHWLDEDGKTYICYSINEIMEDTGCKRNMVIKCLNELRKVGLIETVQRGLGRPNIIYVKNFELVEEESSESRSLENRPLEVQKLNSKKIENQTSGSLENERLEVSKLDPNKKEYNNTNINNTKSIQSIDDEGVDYLASAAELKDRLDIEGLIIKYPGKKEIINELYETILEVLVLKSESVTISKQVYPAQYVKERFGKITHSHLEYVLFCLNTNTKKMNNPKMYLLATLFNSVTTIDNYYSALVRSDMPQLAQENY